MLTISGSHNGHLYINEDTEVLGSVNGDVDVTAPYHLFLKGSINGNLLVRLNAHAEVKGTVTGTLTNESGWVDIWGTVNRLYDKDSNRPSSVHPKAVINERI